MTTGEPDEGENNSNVRKHPAPEGALRQQVVASRRYFHHGQKAPSTRRCIKTPIWRAAKSFISVRKHPAPEGALRLDHQAAAGVGVVPSESTQHQKVH